MRVAKERLNREAHYNRELRENGGKKAVGQDKACST